MDVRVIAAKEPRSVPDEEASVVDEEASGLDEVTSAEDGLASVQDNGLIEANKRPSAVDEGASVEGEDLITAKKRLLIADEGFIATDGRSSVADEGFIATDGRSSVVDEGTPFGDERVMAMGTNEHVNEHLTSTDAVRHVSGRWPLKDAQKPSGAPSSFFCAARIVATSAIRKLTARFAASSPSSST